MRLCASLAIAGILLLSMQVSSLDLRLDVGNDTLSPFEWTERNTFTGPETVPDFSARLNEILSSECSCNGCSIDGPYCVIPLTITSAYPGKMQLNNVDINYRSVTVLSSVTYGEAFKLSEGCQWTIQHLGGTSVVNVPSTYSGPNTCYYTSSQLHPVDTQDALIDAVDRLLNQTLDADQNSIIDINFDEAAMSFETHGMIGVQSLWGPAVVKVVVWI